MKNYFKLGIFLFGISTLLWNCDNPDLNVFENQATKIDNLKLWFNNNHNKELEENNYYIGNLDQDNLISIDERFYIPFYGDQKLKFRDKKNTLLKTSKPIPYLFLEGNDNNFRENLIVFIDKESKTKYLQDEIINYPYLLYDNQNYFIENSFSESRKKPNKNTFNRSSECVEWGVYLETNYGDDTYEYELLYTYDVCDQDGDEEFFQGGGGGNGSSGSSNIVVDVPPDCASFSYSRVGGTNWQTSAVSGVRELFTVFNWECTGFDYGTLPQAIYFQLPINSSFPLGSGHTQTESAVALHEAFKSFDNWYQNNACSSSYNVMTEKFFQYIKDEFEDLGGKATINPPLGFVGNITPYQSTWYGYGNCN